MKAGRRALLFCTRGGTDGWQHSLRLSALIKQCQVKERLGYSNSDEMELNVLIYINRTIILTKVKDL